MNIEIGSYEAKTKLPELLRGVQAGNRYIITSRGKAVADLGPVERVGKVDYTDAVEQMKLIMLSANNDSRINIKDLMTEGRD